MGRGNVTLAGSPSAAPLAGAQGLRSYDMPMLLHGITLAALIAFGGLATAEAQGQVLVSNTAQTDGGLTGLFCSGSLV